MVLGLAALATVGGLASCDKVEASLPSDQANQKVIDIDINIDVNTKSEIYDALITSGSTNSEKILNNILYIYAQSQFGAFFDDGDTKGLMSVASAYIAATDSEGNTSNNDVVTAFNSFIDAHSALAYKNADGSIDYAKSRVRAAYIYNQILYKVYDAFMGYVSNSSYQDRSLFNERKFYDAQIKNYYKLGTRPEDTYIQVSGDDILRLEDINQDGVTYDVITKYWGTTIFTTYQNYIEEAVLPDIYRNLITVEYLYNHNASQIYLTPARKVTYISLAENESSSATQKDAVASLIHAYADKVIAKGLMDTYPLTFLSELYKGTNEDYNTATSSSEGLAKMAYDIYTAAGWTASSFERNTTVDGVQTTETTYYYSETKFGAICDDYVSLTNNINRDDSDWKDTYNDFTSSGNYSVWTGFNVKKQSLITESNVSTGWFTSGGLSSLPSSLSGRIFKNGVANEVDDEDNYKGNYGVYIEGKYFLEPESYYDADPYPYVVEDSSKYYIVNVEEASKTSKFAASSSTSTNYTYDSRGTLGAEIIARQIAYQLSSVDSWKSDAKSYYVEQMALMYNDDYVYDYFKSTFPDLFD